jgi:hypothetical protein
MTRRILRITTTLVIIQSLIFFPAPVSRAQDGLTQADIILAEEIADRFMKRLDETGDFSSVVDEMYAEDFIERYIGLYEDKSSPDFFFEPGLKIKRDLLKRATAEDWKRLYIAVHNLIYHIFVLGLNKHADDYLNGREPDDETSGNCIPSKVIELLNNHPILKGPFGADEGKPEVSDASAEENKPKPIETPEELQDVIETLQEAERLLHADQSPRLTEPAKAALEIFRLKLKDEGKMDPEIDILDEQDLGLAVGTRVLIVTTPLTFHLMIADVKGKQKVVGTHLHTGC